MSVNTDDIGNAIEFSDDLIAPFLDDNKILWKKDAGIWTGKRSVLTVDNKVDWAEEVGVYDVADYWAGGDYDETFLSHA